MLSLIIFSLMIGIVVLLLRAVSVRVRDMNSCYDFEYMLKIHGTSSSCNYDIPVVNAVFIIGDRGYCCMLKILISVRSYVIVIPGLESCHFERTRKAYL
jgi:hypothetical protein